MRLKNSLLALILFVFASSIFTGFIYKKLSPDNSRKWEIYTDLKNVAAISVSKTGSVAYCGTEGGVFSVDLNNGNIIDKYTSLNGLIGNNTKSIITDNLNRLWIGSSDGSISVLNLDTKQWRYIYDIKNSTQTSKSINDFLIIGDNIFIATDYGIHKVSISTFNFIDAPYTRLGTFSINTKVNSLATSHDTLFAATVSGVAYAPLNANLNSPSNWTNYAETPLSANVNVIEEFDDMIFAGSLSGLSYYNFSNWQPYPEPGLSVALIRSISEIGDRIFISANNEIVYAFKGNLSNLNPFHHSGVFNVIHKDNFNNPILGENENGTVLSIGGQLKNYYPNSPNRNSFNYITEDNKGNIWAAGAGEAGFYKFDGTMWTTYVKELYPEIGNSNNFSKVIHGNGNVWAINYGSGPTIIRPDNTIKNYNPSNSNLPGIQGSPNFCVPAGGAYDNNGIFWITFYQQNSGRSLYAYTGDSIFVDFTNPPIVSSANFEEVAVDAYNTKWIVSGELSPRGLYFFNENGTLTNPNDDIYGMYYTSELGVDDITDVIVDKNNEVWFSTNNGVFIIVNPLAAIQDPQNNPPVKLGIISGGLKVPFTENCRSLANDILNQKWIGTESNGVFHLSQDGSTLIEQFNTSNSPVADNKINGIVVSPISGKAFFATLNGLSAVNTDAIQPLTEFDKIICSPNPYVLPSSVNLKIDGLVENSSVKIISLSGEVVREFDSPGGRIATWNGLDLKGKLVPSGIYIVVAFNKDGSKTGKGKVAIVRK